MPSFSAEQVGSITKLTENVDEEALDKPFLLPLQSASSQSTRQQTVIMEFI